MSVAAREICCDPFDRIELPWLQVRVGNLHREFALEFGDQVRQAEGIQQPRFEQRLIRSGVDRLTGDLPEDLNDLVLRV